jgi:hypothetical protein
MSVNLSPIGNGFQFLTATGLPLAGGKIYTYQAGSSTSLATYSDNGGVYPNANPIVLGADGRPASEIWLTYGYNYKFILTDANDVQIQSYDNLYGIIGTAPSSGATIPAGLISLWSGAVGSVPSGWYLCDGSNGTPDLRDRFVVGAGSTYAVGATGGSADAIVVDHTHTATSTSNVNDPGHSHSYTQVHTPYNVSINDRPYAWQTRSANTSTSTTGITVSTSTTVSSAGTSGTGQNLPPYYALAYIMKS